MDQLRAMRVFLQVAETHSFARAADALQCSRTSVTTLVAQLERHLGARLLHRTTRHVALTPDGATYREHCKRIIADLETADDLIRKAGDRPQGRLRVDVPHSFGRYLLMPALPAFNQRYPELALDISFSDRFVDLEAEGIDVALRGGVGKRARLIAREIAQSRRVTCAAPQYLARASTPSTPADLRAHRLIGYQAGKARSTDWQFCHDGQVERVKLPFSLTFNSAEAPIVSALEGAGIIQTVDLLVAQLLAEGRLVEILHRFACDGPPLSVVYPPANKNNAKVRVFAEFAAELMRDWKRRSSRPRQAKLSA
ncbi:MAG: LysR family transcriptional regulator [Proteobacteria bacterium]|nr:LysR family transcriptional regulator [Pseudomonadota bacterium]